MQTEHIDYAGLWSSYILEILPLLADLTVVSGLSVMPAAIDRDVIQACTATPSKDGKSRVHISNVNGKFKAEEFEFQPGKEGPAIDPKHHR